MPIKKLQSIHLAKYQAAEKKGEAALDGLMWSEFQNVLLGEESAHEEHLQTFEQVGLGILDPHAEECNQTLIYTTHTN